jgi:hypothetical protein
MMKKELETPKSKSIVERIDIIDDQIAKLNEDVKELKAVFYLVKNNIDNNNRQQPGGPDGPALYHSFYRQSLPFYTPIGVGRGR